MARRKIKYYSPKRRAIYAKGDSINALEVFEAHGWVCVVCKKTIDRRRRYPDWKSATIDHVVPLSKGGTHTLDNVAPAHLKCNLDKGDSMPQTA